MVRFVAERITDPARILADRLTWMVPERLKAIVHPWIGQSTETFASMLRFPAPCA